MVQFNFSERTIKAKVVYYGPAQSGKTTNLEQIHRITDPAGNNRLISLNTAQDRTLFFDLLPFSLGAVAGYDFKVQLYTVPGQVQYNATRRVVLAGADAVVFVVDSRKSAFKENLAAFENMKVNLLANRLVPEKVPLIIQYNKQDLPELMTEAELNRTLNPWGRRYFLAVGSVGQGVAETFVAVVQDMLQAIAVKYNLKDKGLDPAQVPAVVADAFADVLKQAARDAPPPPADGSPPPPPPPPAKVVLSQATESINAAPLSSSPDTGLVSEELLHRSIRSNVELAEALAGLVLEMNLGLGTILSHAELLMVYREEAKEKRNAAISSIQSEATRLRRIMQELGHAGASAAPAAPPPQPAPARPTSTTQSLPAQPLPILPLSELAPPARPAPAPRPPVPAPAPAPAAVAAPPVRPAPAAPGAAPASFDLLLREALGGVQWAFDARGVTVSLQVAANTALPRCPPANLHKAITGVLEGIAMGALPRSTLALRCERKPVLLRTKEGEVKRDFLMLAIAHGGTFTPEDQQRIMQGTDQGPSGQASRLVREMGGFVRFAPLPGGGLETRIFLPTP